MPKPMPATASYGFKVSVQGVGAAVYNVGGSGGAFGVADNSWLGVLDALKKVNGSYNRSKNVFYNGGSKLTNQANTVLTGINQAGGLTS